MISKGNLISVKEIEMVSIPGSTFILGSPISEVDRNPDETQHQVTLSDYYKSIQEVTFEQYDSYCEATGSSKPDDAGWGRVKRPVINISWDDEIAYCEWLSIATGKTYRLPTEAEWEYACRAGTTTPFYTGNNLTTSQANYNGNYPYNNYAKGEFMEKTLPVGSFAHNNWGLYDMLCNIWEWCSHWYDDYSTSEQTNPNGASLGSARVTRGGSWINRANFCRSAERNCCNPDFRFIHLVFRLVSPK